MDLEEIRKNWLGKEWPVWRDTNGHREQHRATILEVLPYNGPFEFVACIFRLTAPRSFRGYTEMRIEKIDLAYPEILT